jgi:hypothetical protein
MALIYTWFQFFLWSIVLYTSSAVACTLPTDSLGNAELFPQRVREQFCNPEAGYTSLLLIQAAINEDTPVFRVIAVRRDGSDHVQNVRLYQFDKDGNDHPDVAGEPQAVIDFKGSSSRFEARVKGRKTPFPLWNTPSSSICAEFTGLGSSSILTRREGLPSAEGSPPFFSSAR